MIYPGCNATFLLYEDEGDNYNYERGAYSTIEMKWDNKKRTLTIDSRKGNFPGMMTNRKFNIRLAGTEDVKTVNYNGAGWLYFICLEKSDDVQLVLKALEEAAVSAKKLFGYAFSCGAGIPVDDIVLAKESYQQAKKAISYNKLQKDDSVTYYNDVLMNDDLHVKEYVDKNYRDPDISIDSICQELHISASHFSKIFKRQTGTSFSLSRFR